MCVGLFGVGSVVFSLRNIEDSLLAQSVFFVLRLVLLALMIGSSIYVVLHYGSRWSSMQAFDVRHFYLGFSSAIFVFILHPSIPAFLAPASDQRAAKRLYFWLFFFTMALLILEATAACLAFQGLPCASFPFGLSVGPLCYSRIYTISISSVFKAWARWPTTTQCST